MSLLGHYLIQGGGNLVPWNGLVSAALFFGQTTIENSDTAIGS